ncbi:hypothetical protein [Salinimicrobium marinum]|uniref:hypothetical protein n=1 Tax=Salinimicrobium marinum TaxID=680283 RepID=UPI001671A387|nr:hypothetical protein [Salinimicrobium marinum]
MDKDGEENKQLKPDSGKSNYSHLKWPAIILVILIFLLIVALDYFSRTGEL